jgi:hypothetical protein
MQDRDPVAGGDRQTDRQTNRQKERERERKRGREKGRGSSRNHCLPVLWMGGGNDNFGLVA